MRIKTRCPHCGKKLGGPPSLRGKSVKCSKCAKPFTVPADLEPIEDQPAAQAAEPEDNLAIMGLEEPGPGAPARGGAPVVGPGPWTPKGSGGGARNREVAQMAGALVLVAAIGYAGYHFYLKKEKEAGPTAQNKKSDKAGKDDKATNEDGDATPPPQKVEPVAAVTSRLKIENRRFPMLNVFGPQGKLGTVNLGETQTFEMEVKHGGVYKINYEVLGLPRGSKLPKDLETKLSNGETFFDLAKTGHRIRFAGPPEGLLPEPGFRFRTVAGEDATFDPGSGRAMVRKVIFKENTLLPAYGAKTMFLEYKKDGNRDLFFWMHQDCVIQNKEGTVLYDPAAKLWVTEKLPLAEPAE